jgi:hypothetical protein
MPNTASLSLPTFLCDLLAAPPRQGQGVHQWIYRLARNLHAHRNESEIRELLAAALEGCGRPVSLQEIEDAVRNSRSSAWRPAADGTSTTRPLAQPKWPAVDLDLRAAVLADMGGFGIADLWECSPYSLDASEPQTNRVVAALFPSECLLCAGLDNRIAITAPLSEWLGGDMAQLQFVVPSPMTAISGTNKSGRDSARCLDNTGPRRFLVVECDQGTINEQAAVLRWLAEKAPLALVVHSAGKSLHGWFYCAGQPENPLLAFMRRAVSLGADPAMWVRCQLARMPDGTRFFATDRKPAKQAIYFFNPSICR